MADHLFRPIFIEFLVTDHRHWCCGVIAVFQYRDLCEADLEHQACLARGGITIYSPKNMDFGLDSVGLTGFPRVFRCSTRRLLASNLSGSGSDNRPERRRERLFAAIRSPIETLDLQGNHSFVVTIAVCSKRCFGEQNTMRTRK
ncbi:hypothetical protein [Psychromicrobium sp. YIM B11713]|uniref:hypothetical protein n=1 Tax=Psychromicrobium sp. YIM B11713 TaxID=3145233 RepID=UPI00374E74F8